MSVDEEHGFYDADGNLLDDEDAVILPFDAGERALMAGLGPLPSSQPTPQFEHDDWGFVDLADPTLEEPPTPPDLGRFLYSGMRHMISGPPEATKTLVLYHDALELARRGRAVGIIDFEMGAKRAVLLMRELKATNDDLRRIFFVEPQSPPRQGELERFIEAGCCLVIIDASVGAYRASGLDDNSRVDAERFAEMWIKPLWRAGIATATIDHVTKDKETRGGFAIGSERKVGQADVHIGLTTTHKLERGGKTTISVEVHKDRPAFLRRPHPFFIDIVSHEITHELSVTYREAEKMQRTEKGGQRPTINMDRVSHWLTQQDGPQSRNAIEEAVKGNRESIRRAIDVLVAEGYCSSEEGPRGSKIITVQRPYSKAAEEAAERASQHTTSPNAFGRGQSPSSSPDLAHDLAHPDPAPDPSIHAGSDDLAPPRPDLAPTSPRAKSGAPHDATSPNPALAPPLTGGPGLGEVAAAPEGEVGATDEDELQRLLELYDDELGGNE